MIDEKLMSLSFSVEANKGVYALLLGSGISYSAGIPTGWGVLKELCRRIMLLNGADDQDEIKWYEEKFGKAPLYDEVIGMLARTSSERNGLLKEFFEPTEEDLVHNRKLPTVAHRAIAELVKQGYIKVVVTTNFDRLLEQALDGLNVQYQTLYHDSDIEGMKPLAHADCTVLKIHGDYRDTRFKNITDELESYSEPLTDILEKIFDEYGLIISGWSAEWDTALRDTIKSVKGRRYSWYWHAFSTEINEKARELVNFRDASIIIDSEGADHFFNSLLENVESINKVKRVNPESLQVKIKSLQKYLLNQQDMEISQLIGHETKNILDYFNNINYHQHVSKEIVRQYVEELNEKVKPLSVLLFLLSYDVKTNKQEQLIIETIERLTSFKHDGQIRLLNLQQLPLQIILYSIGIALVKSQNYELLNKVFVKPKARDRIHNRLDFMTFSSPYRGLGELFNFLYSPTNFHLPMEEFMNQYLENVLVATQLIFDKIEFEIYYDFFEFIRCIKYRYHGKGGYYPSGRFGFKPYERRHLEQLIQEGKGNENWNLFILTGQKESDFGNALNSLVKDLNENYRFDGQGLLEAYFGKEN
ncbi:SIR2 family protein [Neobacillus sp. NRS-1170]|uniref:SIR2 family protein n=1 Tax=Neobacillus sp. NRS-1170 TaxID=3233898 RepID=UPI003D29C2CD